MLLEWGPQGFPIHTSNNKQWFWSSKGCQVLALFQIFFEYQSPTWHLILAYHLIYLLLGFKYENLQKQKKTLYFIAIFLPTFLTLLPIIISLINNKEALYDYGEYTNGNYDKDCILRIESYQMIQMIIVQIALIFHYFVLLIVLYKKNYNQLNSHSLRYQVIVKKISNFVIVFTIIYIFPIIERYWELFDPKPVPIWIICLHHWCIASIGLSDAITYILNNRITIKSEKKKQQKKEKQQTYKVLYMNMDFFNNSSINNNTTTQITTTNEYTSENI